MSESLSPVTPRKPINPKLAALMPGERKRASSLRANAPRRATVEDDADVGSSTVFPKLTRTTVSSERNTAGLLMSAGSESTTVTALGSPNAPASPLLGRGRVSMQLAPSRYRAGSSAGSMPIAVTYQLSRSTNSSLSTDSSEDVRPNLEEYKLESICKGGQGTVYRGICPRTGAEVAVKKSNLKEEAPKVNAERERDVLRAMRGHPDHPRLMTADYCYVDEEADEMVTIMKYYPTDLYTAMKTSPKGSIDGRTSYRLLDQLLEAAGTLHQRGFVHRDIKPENIMLTGTDITTADLVLCDFGLCGIITKSNMLRSICGSKRYSAPEVWCKTPEKMYDGIKVDTWSAGMVFFCLYCGFCPWESPDATSDKVFRVWSSDATVFFDWAKKFSKNELDPMTKMLFRGLCHPEPKERLSIEDARWLVKNKRFD